MKAKKVKSTKPQSKKRTNICLILDKSGSMIGCKTETINGFNSQLDVIRKNMEKGGETTVTLITFNQDINVLQTAVHADSVEGITGTSYQPDGSTAMYDAVWAGIESLEKLDDGKEQTAFLVITISDGQENASRKITSAQLAEKVQELEGSKRWTFGYVGANQDLSKISKQMNIQQNNMMCYDASTTGTRRMYEAVNCSTANYMDNRSKGVTWTESLYNDSEKKDENK